MAYTSGIFDDVEYRSSIFADMIAGFISDGVNGTVSTYLQVVANADMVVTIQDGFAWIKGHVFRVNGAENLTISTADGSLGRIDRIIVRFDKQIYPHAIYPMVLKGSLSYNPVPPALVRTEDIYDLCLAEIRIDAGTTAITQAMITDKRGYDDVCGHVVALGQHLDLSTIFAQYEAQWQAFRGKMSAGDVASNLQIQIDDVNENGSKKIKGKALSSTPFKANQVLMTNTDNDKLIPYSLGQSTLIADGMPTVSGLNFSLPATDFNFITVLIDGYSGQYYGRQAFIFTIPVSILPISNLPFPQDNSSGYKARTLNITSENITFTGDLTPVKVWGVI